MVRKLFNVLAFVALLSVVSTAVLLLYSRSSVLTFFKKSHTLEENGAFSEVDKRVHELLSMEPNGLGDVPNENPEKNPGITVQSEKTTEMTEKAPTTTQTILGPCPSIPEHLEGPLSVEFNTNRTLNSVRQEYSALLQEGGRYKPPHCIAQQKVAIIIPFRNRHEHLIHWLHYLHPILMRQQLDYGVYIINQDGEGVFNRAKLMNVGYVEALNEYDYDCFVFSDVDLVPMDDRNFYRCFDSPRHLAVAMDKFNFHLPYNNYFGGVSSLSKEQYLKINGFPNTYWGWGGEDDDIYQRVIFHGMKISRPNLVVGKYRMVKHKRDKHNEANPQNPGKLSKTRSTMNEDGINSLKYTVVKSEKDKLFTFITVDIFPPPS